MTALLALPDYLTPEIVRALETKARPVLIWREFQDCAGNTESMLRSSHPDIAEIVLDLLSLEYHETIMAGSGKAAEAVIDRVRREKKGQYIAIVEGAIPTGSNAAYCTIGGKTAEQLVTELARDAALTIAVGACAWDGGFVALGPTGGKGLSAVVPGVPVINLGGCPHNPANTAAVIVHYLTFGEAPALDQYGRPLFAYGHIIHDQCERRAHFDAGRFVERWGDEGHRNGWCLYKMGCKGPAATFNCPIVRWNDATNWPIGAGHGCIACASPTFWSTMSPFYERLPNIQLFGVDASAQTIGLIAVAGVAAATAVHGAIVVGRRVREGRRATIGPGGQVLPEAEVPDPAAGAPVRLDGDGDERGGSA
jgi:hydrogenase small subunit